MRSKQYILRLKFTVTLSNFQPRELTQEYLITRPQDQLWLAIRSRIKIEIEGLDDESAFNKRKIILKEFFLFELKKTPDGGEELQPVVYWIIGNPVMPEYDVDKVKNYIKKFLAQKPALTATRIPGPGTQQQILQAFNEAKIMCK
jgi:hypothetical protein